MNAPQQQGVHFYFYFFVFMIIGSRLLSISICGNFVYSDKFIYSGKFLPLSEPFRSFFGDNGTSQTIPK